MNGSIQSTHVFDRLNVIIGIIVSALSYVLGEHWILFFAFLCLNIGDYITGCLKARLANKTSSVRGAIGVFKKLGYWLMIMVAFGSSAIFIEIGEVIGINLGVTSLIGWFVLSTLIINELRSIIENFIEAGYKVPEILSRGLEVADKAVKGTMSVAEELIEKDEK